MSADATRAAPAPPQPSASEPPPDPAVIGDGDLAGRIATVIITLAPILALGFVVKQAWDEMLGWRDLVVFGVTYVGCGLGITVGFHRYLTHRSFKAGRVVRFVLAVLGSAAIEGPAIEWVANHRKHHTFSDREGDPHSPHTGDGRGPSGALRGLWHAHLGWLFLPGVADSARYAPDLVADPIISFVDRTFLLWTLLGLAFPFGLGVALSGTIAGGLTGLLWGGAVRMLVLHHATFSINSLCHYFGRRAYATTDQSRNLGWLAYFSFGEAWHNNHHAFPTSAFHGLTRWQFDSSAMAIRALERLGLVWDVVRVAPERLTGKTDVEVGAPSR